MTALGLSPEIERRDMEMERLEFNFEYFPHSVEDAANYSFLWWKKLMGSNSGYLLFHNPNMIKLEYDQELFYKIINGYFPSSADSQVVFAKRKEEPKVS